ncbi:MAG TPA: Fe-S cluster assembly ATPase SufC [Flexilinea sp.]|jgi:Fe-S cluster assembly ATP-binding protein|nr:Fe-S cluster assembly ATPase SufC [Flexilinea sp.]OQA28562.1 MAG: Vegetative protein 296 [Chloroflexi bacterium ADurb.Bin344]HNY19161.1 Fe-S cluster assembly ATPase SufC [Flexilinea sp.]HNY93545.1 Fe-S cluster assembly ATPase SufC [Flexilinea sp.]HOG22412.1 Fe-S cluster assembly ATPase SufC [Flexilinea sp.]
MIGLEVKDLSVTVHDKKIINHLSIQVPKGEIHAIMGPNGTGKSTLSYTIMGHPAYRPDEGEILLNDQLINDWPPDKRSHAGLFLALQYPVAIPGVTVANFLRTALNIHRKSKNPDDHGIPIPEFRKLLKEKMKMLKMDPDFAGRYLNDGFSGGEKKRTEVLQMAILEPEIAILDEIDSGLDIDALRIVSEGINILVDQTHMGVLIITHYQRLLDYIKPQAVHVMMDGQIVRTGDANLALELEEKGYDWIRQEQTTA